MTSKTFGADHHTSFGANPLTAANLLRFHASWALDYLSCMDARQRIFLHTTLTMAKWLQVRSVFRFPVTPPPVSLGPGRLFL